MNPFTALPPKWRAALYWAAFIVGVVLGVLHIWYTNDPRWLVKADATLPYVTTAFGLVAATNTVTKARRAYVEHVTPDTVAAKVVERLRDDKGRFRSPADRV